MNRDSERPFPDFHLGAFTKQALEETESNVALIDGAGEILWVNPAWRRFAQANGDGHSHYDRGSYFDAITPPLRDYFYEAFRDSLASGTPYTQEYQCSSPTIFRIFHLRALPIEGALLILEHSLLVGHAHDAVTDVGNFSVDKYCDNDGLIKQCSNCRRVNQPQSMRWDFIPRLVEKIDPRTSHGLCPSCEDFYWRRRPKRR